MEETLQGKSAVVANAAVGLGRVMAASLARAGARVLLADPCEKAGLEMCEAIRREGGEASFLQCDLSRPHHAKMLAERIRDLFGRVDLACLAPPVGDARIPGTLPSIAESREEFTLMNPLRRGARKEAP